MPNSRSDSSFQRLYWPYALGRAVVFSFLAIAITFSQDHSAPLGLLLFSAFALLSAGVGMWWWRGARKVFSAAPWILGQSVVSLVAAVSAVGFVVAGAGDIRSLLVILAGWAAIAGLVETFLGMRLRHRHGASGDFIAVGLWTMLAATVFVLVPPDFSEQFVGDQKVTSVLDSSVVTVGFLGAYAAVAAVFLLIAALSARSAPAGATVVAPQIDDVTESESR